MQKQDNQDAGFLRIHLTYVFPITFSTTDFSVVFNWNMGICLG